MCKQQYENRWRESEYEQMTLDTRQELTKAVANLTADVIEAVRRMIDQCGEAPSAVRNRHEAYGIAAEHLSKITAIVKAIKADCGTLLGTLDNPNSPALEATSSIVNSTATAAATLLIAAAEMSRTLNNLYMAERQESEQMPLEDWAENTEFEEAASMEDVYTED